MSLVNNYFRRAVVITGSYQGERRLLQALIRKAPATAQQAVEEFLDTGRPDRLEALLPWAGALLRLAGEGRSVFLPDPEENDMFLWLLIASVQATDPFQALERCARVVAVFCAMRYLPMGTETRISGFPKRMNSLFLAWLHAGQFPSVEEIRDKIVDEKVRESEEDGYLEEKSDYGFDENAYLDAMHGLWSDRAQDVQTQDAGLRAHVQKVIGRGEVFTELMANVILYEAARSREVREGDDDHMRVFNDVLERRIRIARIQGRDDPREDELAEVLENGYRLQGEGLANQTFADESRPGVSRELFYKVTALFAEPGEEAHFFPEQAVFRKRYDLTGADGKTKTYHQTVFGSFLAGRFTVMHAYGALVPDIMAHLSRLWAAVHDASRPMDERKRALAEYEWWFFQSNPVGRAGAAMGDAMSFIAQIGLGIPLRETYVHQDLEALSSTLDDYRQQRLQEWGTATAMVPVEQTASVAQPAGSADRAQDGDKPRISYEDLQEAARDDHWWRTAPWWVAKGAPRQTLSFVTGRGKTVEIFNWGRDLTNDEVGRIKAVFDRFAGMKGGIPGDVRYILVSDERAPNPQDEGREMNGYEPVDDNRTIILYPRAFDPVDHRVPGVSNLEGTVAHELGHGLENTIFDAWREEFRWLWSVNDGWRVRKDDGLVTLYARNGPGEDIAESLVAFLFNPGVLDPARAAFLHRTLDKAQGEAAASGRPEAPARRKLARQLRDVSSGIPEETGGIDLTSDKVLQVQEGEAIKFHLDPAQLQQLQDARGFTPVIINVQPVIDVRAFLASSGPHQ